MKYSQVLLLSILLCFFLVQCSNNSTSEKTEHIQELDNLTVYPADSEPVYTLELVPEQSFGGSGKPYWIVITGCVVDDNDRVIIRGQDKDMRTELHDFNPDGTYRSQIGRFGKGYEGYVAFDSKSALIEHYKKKLGAMHLSAQRMFIDTVNALYLVEKYFKD